MVASAGVVGLTHQTADDAFSYAVDVARRINKRRYRGVGKASDVQLSIRALSPRFLIEGARRRARRRRRASVSPPPRSARASCPRRLQREGREARRRVRQRASFKQVLDARGRAALAHDRVNAPEGFGGGRRARTARIPRRASACEHCGGAASPDSVRAGPRFGGGRRRVRGLRAAISECQPRQRGAVARCAPVVSRTIHLALR
jgi:hypothetical protein